MDPGQHDKFRGVEGAWKNTVKGAKILNEAGLPFIVQTTVGKHNFSEIPKLADFAYEEMDAKVFNLYFLVPSGRGQFVSEIEQSQYNKVLMDLKEIQKKYDGRMITNAKCAPHYARSLFESDPDSKFLKSFIGGAGGCPAGTQYMGIRPNGDVTPCPYLPLYGGNLKSQNLKEIWDDSEVFNMIRQRGQLGGRCGDCEFATKCGGCRARAHSLTGDLLAEDPLCDYEPGKFPRGDVEEKFKTQYGISLKNSFVKSDFAVEWTSEADERMKRIPAFVRGMVKKRVEKYCQDRAITVITEPVLTEIRSKMPTPKVFGGFKK